MVLGDFMSFEFRIFIQWKEEEKEVMTLKNRISSFKKKDQMLAWNLLIIGNP